MVCTEAASYGLSISFSQNRIRVEPSNVLLELIQVKATKS